MRFLTTIVVEIFLAMAAMTFVAGFSAVAAAEEVAPIINTSGETTPAVTAPVPQPGWLERETLTGDSVSAVCERQDVASCPFRPSKGRKSRALPHPGPIALQLAARQLLILWQRTIPISREN